MFVITLAKFGFVSFYFGTHNQYLLGAIEYIYFGSLISLIFVFVCVHVDIGFSVIFIHIKHCLISEACKKIYMRLVVFCCFGWSFECVV